MKKLLIILGLSVIVFTGCKEKTDDITKDDPTEEGNGLVVTKKQRSILFYYTATWCGPCGAYGSPAFKSLATNSTYDDLTMIDMHTSNSQLVPFYKNLDNDTFYISPAQQMLNNLPLPGSVPAFFLNGTYKGSNVTTSTILNEVETANTPEATVGVAARATADGKSIKIETKTTFFTPTDGTYHLSALLLEKDVNFRQAVGSSYVEDFDHKYILKASARDGQLHTQNVYGDDPIAEGSIAADHSVEGEYIFEHQDIGTPNANFPAWVYSASNTAVVVIIWKDLSNGKKEVVNSIMLDVE